MPANPQMPENPETPEELQAKLVAYQQAIQEEYAVELKAKPDQAAELTQEFFKENMPLAGGVLVHLCEHSDSDTVRMNCAKFIIEQGNKDAIRDCDPMAEILRQLTAPKSKEKA